MALVRLPVDTLAEFSDVLTERARVIGSVLGESEFYDAQATELEFLAYYVRHRQIIMQRKSNEGLCRFCIKCLKMVESPLSFCFSCNDDRWLILTR